MRWRGRRPRWQHERRVATGVADGPAICTDSWTCVLARADGLVTGSLHAFSVERRRRGVLHNAFRLPRAPNPVAATRGLTSVDPPDNPFFPIAPSDVPPDTLRRCRAPAPPKATIEQLRLPHRPSMRTRRAQSPNRLLVSVHAAPLERRSKVSGHMILRTRTLWRRIASLKSERHQRDASLTAKSSILPTNPN